MKGALTACALAGVVGLLLQELVPEPIAATGRRIGPPTDLPLTFGYRAIWATGAPLGSLVSPWDRVLEVVTADAPLTSSPQVGAAAVLEAMARRWPIAIVVTVLDVAATRELSAAEIATTWTPPRTQLETRRIYARVEEVLGNRTHRIIGSGATFSFSYQGGGEKQVGSTRVVARHACERVPERGRRYLWFLSEVGRGLYGGAAGNAFDITGSAVQPLYRRPAALWRTFSSRQALHQVRIDASLPEWDMYDEARRNGRGGVID